MDRVQNLGFLLKDVSRIYTKRFEERAQGLELTLVQCKALIFLTKNEGISQKRLAELIDVDPMSLVRILDRMEADGWVERQSDPDDRRARSLRVTQKAMPVVDQILQIAAKLRAEVLTGLSTEECESLIGLLEHVHENLMSMKPVATEAVTDRTSHSPKPLRSVR
ncbi:MAG TPA: MarR family transcriptional regulator [Steroidobacteraceae bacterium]|nr:MarR family transcriptional regulator [Steroidobacteraceae bacterium]